MDIGKGLEHLATMGALIVLGSVLGTLFLMIGVFALGDYALRRLRRADAPGRDG